MAKLRTFAPSDPTVITRKELAGLLKITVNSVRKMEETRRAGMPQAIGKNGNRSLCYDRAQALAWVALNPVHKKYRVKQVIEAEPITFADIFSGRYDRPSRRSIYEFRKFVSSYTQPKTITVQIEGFRYY
jgi:hypothetical protein